ncbi:MAG TPA: carboxymuconolactone decarboxylase family protein [Burkholderiales bacterium]|nr:carboxymuconolactone decarboxylase family protein [Burkholderiales bacterium]
MATKQKTKKKDPYGYSEMTWAETLDPEYARVRDELRRVAVSDGALPVKVKEMIVIGILASRGLQYGVAAHMRRAVEHGATRQELFEALKAAHIPGGGVAYSVGIRALQELELAGVFKSEKTTAGSKANARSAGRSR